MGKRKLGVSKRVVGRGVGRSSQAGRVQLNRRAARPGRRAGKAEPLNNFRHSRRVAPIAMHSTEQP